MSGDCVSKNKFYLTVFIISAIIGFNLASAHATERFTPANRHHHCRYESWNGRRGFSEFEVRLMVVCLVDQFPVAGGVPQAIFVIDRESSFACRAQNPYSSARGLFQVVEGTWTSWWSRIHPRLRGWGIMNNRGLCRANATVSIVAAHRWGWGPWSM
jgi:hypothetical protein